LAGADAVQVGTATFADPRTPRRVLEQVARWCTDHDVAKVTALVGAVAANAEAEEDAEDGGT
jgi:dihydroorotate dehydrogenase (NAD+) catalytic subunit